MSDSMPTLPSGEAGSTPLYQQVKDYVRHSILIGDWPVDHRIPSESELVRLSGASRMTVHRALRELKDDGWAAPGPGAGDIRGRPPHPPRPAGNPQHRRRHPQPRRLWLRRRLARTQLAAGRRRRRAGNEAGTDLFHSRLVHRLDGAPFQLEDRWVNPAAAPDFLGVDLARQTPNEYLMHAAPLSEVEHRLEAVLPGPVEQALLGIDRHQPCLLLHRRTWSGGRVASRAWLTHPGDRFYLATRFAHDAGLPRSPKAEDMP